MARKGGFDINSANKTATVTAEVKEQIEAKADDVVSLYNERFATIDLKGKIKIFKHRESRHLYDEKYSIMSLESFKLDTRNERTESIAPDGKVSVSNMSDV